MRPLLRVSLLLLGLGCVFGLTADVVDSTAGGFTLQKTFSIQATPDQVYQKLVGEIGKWWDPAHTYSGKAENYTIDARPMGCFCEKLPQGGVRHMEVVYADPGKRLVMLGGLGPLQTMAVSGSLEVAFAAENGGTKLTVTYAVGGYAPGGLQPMAAPVDDVLMQQFVRLKHYVESGQPVVINAP